MRYFTWKVELVSNILQLIVDLFKDVAFYGGVYILHLWLKISFLDKFGQTNQNCQFKLKFGEKTNSSMYNPLVLFTFSAFDLKYFIGQICKEIKIVLLNWN